MGLETYRTADVDFVLRDAGIRVRAGGVTTYGLFKVEGVTVLDAEGYSGVLADELTVVIRTGSLALTVGSAIQLEHVSGAWTTYTVRDHHAIGDGAMTRYHLVEA